VRPDNLWTSFGTAPRKRRVTWREGRRVDTGTWYTIPDPTASVVELAGAQRKRA
jgi:hypothetical protein